MRWNPFLSKRGRIIAVVVMLFLLPTGYLASYPIAYRLLVGSDANSHESVPARTGCCLCGALPDSAYRRYEAWQKLQRYCFPPVEWLIDRTPTRHIVFAFAGLMDTDEQLQGDRRTRARWRKLELIEEAGGSNALNAFLRQESDEFFRQLEVGLQKYETADSIETEADHQTVD